MRILRRTPVSRKRSLCIKGSPPENTTHSTPSASMSAVWRASSWTEISSASFTFQMSHITQRQLQRLWGKEDQNRERFEVRGRCIQDEILRQPRPSGSPPGEC